jgi:glycosyltransferase involved in cell wall biosynthesis
MNIIQLTPGAGAMYCGNCFRDNALVTALRRMGHSVTMLPLYLPLTLDEEDQSARSRIFFGGINVYLEQQSSLFNRTPGWVHSLLSSRPLLWWAAGKAAKTRAQDVGEITLSMLRGEDGKQARELEELLEWLIRSKQKIDIVCLSNALLLGLGRRLKSELGAPLVCTLQGEDSFLDALPADHRAACGQVLMERARDVDAFIAPSRYFARVMGERLKAPAERVHVVHNGIELEGYDQPSPARPGVNSLSNRERGRQPVLGFFARMCHEKGLDTLVESFIILKQSRQILNLQLRVGGSCGPADQIFINALRVRLKTQNLIQDVEFHPNLNRDQKIAFLRDLTVFSVPALYGEAYGLYLIEALAAGVPVVQPNTAAFPELLEATGGGILCEPGNPAKLAEAIENLLLEPQKAAALGQAGARAVFEKFHSDAMARGCLDVFESVLSSREILVERSVRK